MRRVLAVLIAMLAFAVPVKAQRVELDTSTAQYQAHPGELTAVATQILLPYAKQLHLAGWRIQLTADSLPENVLGATYVHDEYRSAYITLDLDQISDDRMRETILHELVHIKVEALSWVARSLAGNDRFEQEIIRQRTEALVTDIARSMGP